VKRSEEMSKRDVVARKKRDAERQRDSCSTRLLEDCVQTNASGRVENERLHTSICICQRGVLSTESYGRIAGDINRREKAVRKQIKKERYNICNFNQD
jgi:hypothetical protein